jgi:hypothetical protein
MVAGSARPSSPPERARGLSRKAAGALNGRTPEAEVNTLTVAPPGEAPQGRRIDRRETATVLITFVSGRPGLPDRGTRAVYKLYGDSTAVSSLKQFPDRAHSLVVDRGWRAIADYVLVWLAERGIRADRSEW